MPRCQHLGVVARFFSDHTPPSPSSLAAPDSAWAPTGSVSLGHAPSKRPSPPNLVGPPGRLPPHHLARSHICHPCSNEGLFHSTFLRPLQLRSAAVALSFARLRACSSQTSLPLDTAPPTSLLQGEVANQCRHLEDGAKHYSLPRRRAWIDDTLVILPNPLLLEHSSCSLAHRRTDRIFSP
eukprot:4548206-Amphidinium_carterae.1